MLSFRFLLGLIVTFKNRQSAAGHHEAWVTWGTASESERTAGGERWKILKKINAHQRSRTGLRTCRFCHLR